MLCRTELEPGVGGHATAHLLVGPGAGQVSQGGESQAHTLPRGELRWLGPIAWTDGSLGWEVGLGGGGEDWGMGMG